MRLFIIYHIKYFLTDIFFIIFLGLVLFNLFTVATLLIQPPDFAVFLMVYLLSVYVERGIGQPMPSLLAARGRLAVAVSVRRWRWPSRRGTRRWFCSRRCWRLCAGDSTCFCPA
jgi:hypothetical protein